MFGLTIIAWTVRAVNFLDLIVENGYSILTYFQYSTKHIGYFDKIHTIIIFISFNNFCGETKEENEFIILWTSGVKKFK